MTAARPSFAEAFRFWLKLGFISFGGPAGQIAIMHAELVERRRWVSEERFLHALNFCMLLPGPEAQQLATYIGWLLHGVRGGLAAGILFVLPAAALLWVLSWLYVSHAGVPWLAAVFDGLKPAVVAIVLAAVLRIGRKAVRGPLGWGLALGAFGALAVFKLPFPIVIAVAALVGFFNPKSAETSVSTPVEGSGGFRRALSVLLVCGLIWWIPVLLTGAALGWDHAAARQGLFFSQAAMITFGGAYAVLPYVAQQAVERFGWLPAGAMLDGLALAETTPGPLIMVLQFVGFVGAWNHPGTLAPLVSATLGAFITTWATFAPCFLWIFLGAPYVERLRGNAVLNGMLSAVTAAVAGVILNLAVWFGGRVFFPDAGTDLPAMALALIALAALIRFKLPVTLLVPASGLIGLLRHWL